MPDWAGEVRARLSSLRLSPTRESEIVEELSQHLDDRWRELIAGGASADEATRLTLSQFRGDDAASANLLFADDLDSFGYPTLWVSDQVRHNVGVEQEAHQMLTSSGGSSEANGISSPSGCRVFASIASASKLPLPSPALRVNAFSASSTSFWLRSFFSRASLSICRRLPVMERLKRRSGI